MKPLSEKERKELIALIEAGEPLSAKWRGCLFPDSVRQQEIGKEYRLVYDGKMDSKKTRGEMATYNEIDQWVRKNYGYSVKPCWIADVKEIYGLPVRNAPNRLSRKRLNPCPSVKINSIRAALKHFGMI